MATTKGLTLKNRVVKRVFDVALAIVGLVVTLPVILLAMIIASIETKSYGFFAQKRVGRNGDYFSVVKIKTMKQVEGIDTTVTAANDVRITKSGAFFRKMKIDELPQFWNILIGKMSFVGPRPDVPGYADKLEGDDRIILSVWPGITGPATLKYKNEEEILAAQKDPKSYNDEVIWPDKIRINREYVENYSFWKDLLYIWKTIIS